MAGIDTSIYSQLLRQPKSVAEYDAEALQAQQNRLALQVGQSALDDKQRAIAEGNRLRQVVSGFGANKTANYNSLLSAGNLKEAQAYEKANSEVTKTAAETERLGAQTQKDKFGVILQANGLVGSAAGSIMQNPDYNHAVMVVNDLKTKLGPELAKQIGLEAMEIPRDPAQLKAWANDHYLSSIDTAKQLDDARAKSEGLANRQNQAVLNAATNATSRANNASTNATTQRGQNMANERAKDAASSSKVPAGYKLNSDGTMSFIPGGPADPTSTGGKAPTEFQGKSAGFGARAEQADKLISGLAGKYSPAKVNAKLSAENTPLIGGIAGAAANTLLGENEQQAEQAQRDFINAILRQESGAAIGMGEFENARRQYFPQPGDKPGVLEQKAANRKLAVQGLKGSAGKAAFSAPSSAPAAALPAGWSVERN